MGRTQSPFVPPPGSRPGLRDCGWLLAYGLRGLAELICARLAFRKLAVRDLLARNSEMAVLAAAQQSRSDPARIARIGYVIPRISARLPWRSDCVIQAMAAQDWLAGYGLASEIQIGVERPESGVFGAHAWLVLDGKVVTGGAIERYDRMIGESPVT